MNNKGIFCLGFGIATVLSAGIMYASTLVNDVYLSPFQIKLNGNTYNAQMPVLNYQGRTYLALRELGEVTGNEIDFINDTIIVNNNKGIEKKEVINNGTRVVKYGEDIYYWKLNKNSIEKTGIFENYNEIYDTKNELVCKDKNGNEKVILNDVGYGNIYISNDRIFVSNNEIVYSVDLNGNNKKIYEDVNHIYAGNDNCIIASKNNCIVCIYPTTNDVATLFDDSFEFKALKNNIVYYTSTSLDSKTPITIDRINVNTLETDLVNKISLEYLKGLEINYENNNNFEGILQVYDLQVKDGYIYLIYGITAGTGHYLQYSNLCRMKVDGTEFKTIYEYGLDENNINNGAYAISFFEKNNKKYMSVRTIVSSFDLGDDEEKYITIDLETLKQVNVKNDEKNIQDIISSSQEVNDLKNSIYFNCSFSYNNYSIIDDYAYYMVYFSSLCEDADIGWRTGYKLKKSYYIRQNIKTNETEILFEI